MADPTDDSKAFGQRLAEQRERQGFKGPTPAALACGLHPNHFKRLELGAIADVSLPVVRKLARGLNCKPGWLAFGEGRP